MKRSSVAIALLALAHYQARRYEDAVIHARTAIEQKFEMAHIVLGAALARLGRIEEARNAVPAELLSRTSRDAPRLATYARDADRDHFMGGVGMALG